MAAGAVASQHPILQHTPVGMAGNALLDGLQGGSTPAQPSVEGANPNAGRTNIDATSFQDAAQGMGAGRFLNGPLQMADMMPPPQSPSLVAPSNVPDGLANFGGFDGLLGAIPFQQLVSQLNNQQSGLLGGSTYRPDAQPIMGGLRGMGGMR